MGKCAHLLEENSELGRQLGEEWMQTLRIQMAAERKKRQQLQQRIAEFDSHSEQMDSENEKMRTRIADLGKQLKGVRAEVDKVRKEADELRSGTKRKKDVDNQDKRDTE